MRSHISGWWLILILLAGQARGQSGGSHLLPAWAARGGLAAGWLVGAVAASHYWWQSGLGRNPFNNIGEDEPYAEDKIWHLWNGENLTDLHYWALSRGWGVKSPWPAMGLTFIGLSAIEILDASNADGYWKLSLRDEAADIAGILLWYAKHRWPEKVQVRVGIRHWGRSGELFLRLVNYPQARSDQSFCHWEDYAILKTEIIVRPRGYFYFGGAASLKNDPLGRTLPQNLFGATLGFDLTRWLAARSRDAWSPAMQTFGRYFSTSLAYTHWFE